MKSENDTVEVILKFLNYSIENDNFFNIDFQSIYS